MEDVNGVHKHYNGKMLETYCLLCLFENKNKNFKRVRREYIVCKRDRMLVVHAKTIYIIE